MIMFEMLRLPWYALVLPFLVQAQPEGQTAAPFRCGSNICGRRGYVACIDDPSLVDKPQCKNCWRMRQACGTITEHVGCNLYCGDQIRRQEARKLQREIERLNITATDQLQNKESEIQNLTDQIREANKKIAQLQENLNRTKTIELNAHHALRTMDKTTGEGQVTSDTGNTLLFHLTIAALCVMSTIIIGLLFVVGFLYQSKSRLTRYYESKGTLLDHPNDQTDLLHSESSSSAELGETLNTCGNTDTQGTTSVNGQTFTQGTTSANGQTTTDGTTSANGQTPIQGTDGDRYDHDTISQSQNETCKAAKTLSQCPPTQPDRDGGHEVITTIQRQYL